MFHQVKMKRTDAGHCEYMGGPRAIETLSARSVPAGVTHEHLRFSDRADFWKAGRTGHGTPHSMFHALIGEPRARNPAAAA